jgi:hypothetical protein
MVLDADMVKIEEGRICLGKELPLALRRGLLRRPGR